jgi:hypothetical protein
MADIGRRPAQNTGIGKHAAEYIGFLAKKVVNLYHITVDN